MSLVVLLESSTELSFSTVMEVQVRKGPWVEEEDERLSAFVGLFGNRRWDFIARVSGLRRTGKSCRLRWLNYLRPDLKHGRISQDEEEIILRLQARWGNKWSRIARRLPGRTDNEIKNYWRTHLRKRAQGHRAEEEDDQVQGPREATGVKPDFLMENEFHFDSRLSSDFECVGGEDQEATSTNSVNVFPLSVSDMEHDEALASNWASEVTDDSVALHPLEEYDPLGYGHGYFSASNCNFWEFCAGSLWDL